MVVLLMLLLSFSTLESLTRQVRESQLATRKAIPSSRRLARPFERGAAPWPPPSPSAGLLARLQRALGNPRGRDWPWAARVFMAVWTSESHARLEKLLLLFSFFRSRTLIASRLCS